MNARFLGLVGVVAAVVAGCKSDPTNSLVGHPARVGFQFATVRLEVADSLPTYAVVLDAGSNPLTDAVTVTACDPTTVSVAHVSSGAPLTQTNFFIKGVKYGTACVVATADGLTDTMQVGAIPDHLTIATGRDSVVSGVNNTYTFSWFDKKNVLMAGVPAPTWSVASSKIGVFTSQANGTYVGSDTGVTTITVGETFSLLGGTVTQTLNSPPKTVVTTPAAFDGTTNSPAPPGGNLVISANPAGLQYTANTTVLYGATAQTTGHAGVPASVTVSLPDLAVWGSVGAFSLKGVGSVNATQLGGSFAIQTPPTYSGTASATSVFPADVILLTNGVSDSSWGSVAHAYFGGTRAWIIDTTATTAHIALPPTFKTGKQLLLVTGMGSTRLATQDSLTELDSTAYDQFDKVVGGTVENSPNSGLHISADTTVFITLSGACPGGGPTVGGGSVTPAQNCDDYIAVHNARATPDSNLTLTVQWQPSAEIGVTQEVDSYWLPDTMFIGDPTFAEFCVLDGCNGASGKNNPQVSTVVLPAGGTYYILLNMFNIAGRKYALAKVSVTGL